jgi:hypothetical protein
MPFSYANKKFQKQHIPHCCISSTGGLVVWVNTAFCCSIGLTSLSPDISSTSIAGRSGLCP